MSHGQLGRTWPVVLAAWPSPHPGGYACPVDRAPRTRRACESPAPVPCSVRERCLEEQKRRRQRATKKVGTFIGTFLVCFAPYVVTRWVRPRDAGTRQAGRVRDGAAEQGPGASAVAAPLGHTPLQAVRWGSVSAAGSRRRRAPFCVALDSFRLNSERKGLWKSLLRASQMSSCPFILGPPPGSPEGQGRGETEETPAVVGPHCPLGAVEPRPRAQPDPPVNSGGHGPPAQRAQARHPGGSACPAPSDSPTSSLARPGRSLHVGPRSARVRVPSESVKFALSFQRGGGSHRAAVSEIKWLACHPNPPLSCGRRSWHGL